MLASRGLVMPQHEYRCLSYIHSIGIGTVPPTAMTVSEMAYVLQFHQSKSENMKGYCQSMHNTRRRRTLDGLISSIAFLISC
jgi:hypothetical protein